MTVPYLRSDVDVDPLAGYPERCQAYYILEHFEQIPAEIRKMPQVQALGADVVLLVHPSIDAKGDTQIMLYAIPKRVFDAAYEWV
jgi:hypothetical protein